MAATIQRQAKSKSAQLKLANAINLASKNMTMLELVELMESCGIQPRGNPSNTSKKKLLGASLRHGEEPALGEFVKRTLGQSSKNKPVLKNRYTLKLHEKFIGTKVEKFIFTGDFEEAVRVAFVRINNRVKKLSGLGIDGAALMRTAFSKQNPKLSVNDLKTTEDKDEQEGIMHIFEGSVLAFRNPQSHDDEKQITLEECNEVLTLANYLMRLLDDIESRPFI